MWVHWTPRAWHRWFPFEIGLFFFLTLSGFLITRILLAAREQKGSAWAAAWDFLRRRFGRILLPAYVALVFAWLVGAPDVRNHPWVYLLHVANFHIAWLADWPHGTSHFWTLAIQLQFYVIWPFVVLFLPRRWLGWFFAACVVMAPLWRWVLEQRFPAMPHPQAITPVAFDYFGCGALLALALRNGIAIRFLGRLAWICLVGYAVIYTWQQTRGNLPVAGCFQQTLLAVAMAGLIAATWRGLPGATGRFLERPVLQHIGKISYGLYLFHTLVPLALGWVLPQLWYPPWWDGLLAVRLVVFALAAWGLAWLCWRWLEGAGRLRFSRGRG